MADLDLVLGRDLFHTLMVLEDPKSSMRLFRNMDTSGLEIYSRYLLSLIGIAVLTFFFPLNSIWPITNLASL